MGNCGKLTLIHTQDRLIRLHISLIRSRISLINNNQYTFISYFTKTFLEPLM